MKKHWCRFAFVAALVLITGGAFAQPPEENIDPGGGGGGGGGCYLCRGTVYQNGEVVWYCGSPDSGAYGNQYCSIEVDGGYLTCQSYGDLCCVN